MFLLGENYPGSRALCSRGNGTGTAAHLGEPVNNCQLCRRELGERELISSNAGRQREDYVSAQSVTFPRDVFFLSRNFR
jgi:hypothetical protein